MNYIVFDLEFNQDMTSLPAPSEIIQIGAVKLDPDFNTVDTFNRFVKPTLYAKINPFITELTGITTEQLQSEEKFPEVYKAFLDFIAEHDSSFCTWGMSDIKELHKNVKIHNLNSSLLPDKFINIQPYLSVYLNFSPKKMLRLEHAVEELQLPKETDFHNAFCDAVYTAEIFRKIYNPYMLPKTYNSAFSVIQLRQPKRVIDTEGLLKQFEKMYSREMSEEEQAIILLAYKMGKTRQFLKSP